MKYRYITPKINLLEIAAERGYQASVEGPGIGLPGYGTDSDELI